ncbi:stress-response A/B barrel domain-containing protein DABB1 [Arabidopsis lyrata subsp. lyrata]|uniref:stress-response A/B barrel domain-containing protein DABB1 n=1 Tax=Arabidopsis lyrata subsp. lyrata TaxID=81972 RepID=UPI000A29E217|nr:stress-response A/B barrel domain-containing protein DABB1 [Arabidopsis lyrata subsp. lyrata]|eukprot:XP_020867312.1 stress-response A/B barrel domain-containing protein DABB1 [Arabidopsis lyrata subsp. lyrata]
MSSIVEHVVLFKLNDVDSGKINSMVNGINELVNLNQVLHLSCGSIHRLSSTTASDFTHVLHSRYKSKEDLNAYAIHPDHVRVVKESESIREDIMAVDWIADQVPGTLAPPPGSIGKITLLKLKENVSDEAKLEIMEVIKEKFQGCDQITVGENFSPGRSKGFSIGSISYFRDFGEIEAVDDQMKLQKEKIREYIDDTIVVEFVVPSSSSQAI